MFRSILINLSSQIGISQSLVSRIRNENYSISSRVAKEILGFYLSHFHYSEAAPISNNSLAALKLLKIAEYKAQLKNKGYPNSSIQMDAVKLNDYVTLNADILVKVEGISLICFEVVAGEIISKAMYANIFGRFMLLGVKVGVIITPSQEIAFDLSDISHPKIINEIPSVTEAKTKWCH